MLFIGICAAIAAFELVSLTTQFGTKAFKTLLGYKAIPEIIFGVVLPIMGMATGTLTGTVIAVVSGFFITLTLHACSHLVGTRKLQRVNKKLQWVETPGMSFASFVKLLGMKVYQGMHKFTKEITTA